MKTILILSTYPAINARHGGQIRLENIIRSYEQGGWRALPVCIFPEEGYPGLTGPNLIPFPSASPFRLFKGRHIPFIVDLLTGPFGASESGAWKQLLSILPNIVDAVHVEQPWLWPVAEKLRGLPQYRHMALIYGSANVEERLKRRILEPYASADSELALAEVSSLERRATQTADLVLAVTEEEMASLKSWGASHLELAPNGISPWRASDEALAEWRAKLPVAPWLLYVASAHPPNFSGFADLVGGALGCFPPDSRLVIAGGVTEHIYHAMNATKWRALNLSRLTLLHSLNDRDLSAVRTLAHGFFLPVGYGAGSNIKTAEALISGKYVVGTSVAFRGFEHFAGLPEVRVADTASEIHRAIRDVISQPALPLLDVAGDASSRSQLTWNHALRMLPDAVEAASTMRLKALESTTIA